MKKFVVSCLLVFIALTGHAQSNVTQVEYFLDADYGVGMNTVLDISSPNIDITETVLANIPADTEIGYHKLYMRVKDADGHWSQTVKKHIEIVAPNVVNNVVMGEYFIDEDPNYGTATSFVIEPGEDIEQLITAQILATQTIGYHKLYGRVKDANGNWSQTFRKNIEVYLNPDTNVVELEFFFEDDLGIGNNTIVSAENQNEEVSWSFNVPYIPLIYNFDDVLYVRVKDSNGNWSITTILDEIDDNLGVEDNLMDSISMYPNPFVDKVTIGSLQGLSVQRIEVMEMNGRVIYSSSENATSIDLGYLSQGMYFVKLETSKGEATFKLAKK